MVSKIFFSLAKYYPIMKKTNELIYVAVIFYFLFPQYSPHPLNFTWLTFAMTFISCLRSCFCSHEHCLCWSKPHLPVLLAHSIQEDHTVAYNGVMVPEFVASRLTTLSLPQPTCLFSSLSSSLIMHASISTPPPLQPISVPFHPQLEILTFCWQMEHKRRKEHNPLVSVGWRSSKNTNQLGIQHLHWYV